MNIHEYQAKALLRQYGAPVSDGRVVIKADEAKAAAGELDGPLWVVKAQIHAGGRGKGHFKEKEAGEKGGVRLAKSVSEAEELTRQMLGRTLVTHQTGEAGKQVNRIYIEDGSDIERELYLALLVDRGTSRISFVASTEGGMDIEEVAAKTPEKIVSFSVDPASGLSDFHGRRVAFALGLSGPQVKQCVALVKNLYRMFIEKDMEMLEINPLIVTGERERQRHDRLIGLGLLAIPIPDLEDPRLSLQLGALCGPARFVGEQVLNRSRGSTHQRDDLVLLRLQHRAEINDTRFPDLGSRGQIPQLARTGEEVALVVDLLTIRITAW